MTCFNSDGLYVVSKETIVNVFEFKFSKKRKKLFIKCLLDNRTIEVKREHLKMFTRMLEVEIDNFTFAFNNETIPYGESFIEKYDDSTKIFNTETDHYDYVIISFVLRYKLFGIKENDYLEFDKSFIDVLISALNKIIETESL